MAEVVLFPLNRTRHFRHLEADALRLAGGVHGSVSGAAHRFAAAWKGTPHMQRDIVAAAAEHIHQRISEHRATVGLVQSEPRQEPAQVVTMSR